MRFALCNELLHNGDRGWVETCHLVAQAGYTGIEVAPFTLGEDVRSISPPTRHAYANTAQRAGLQVVGLHWLLVSPLGLSITSGDAAIRLETAGYLSALVDFCADLGGSLMVLGSPAQRRIPLGDTSVDAIDRLISVLEPALVRAQHQQVTICLEPLPSPEADFVLNLAQAVAILDRIRHPNLRTIFDVKSANSEQEEFPTLIHRYAPYIAHVHANDANRRGPGFGDTNFVPILQALSAVSYSGFVSVEVFDDSPGPLVVASESHRYLLHCMQQATQPMEDPHA